MSCNVLSWNEYNVIHYTRVSDLLIRGMVLAASFKWRQFEPEVILLAIGWYLRFSLSYRDVEELLPERGCAPITSLSGDGSSGMLRNWSGACANG
jgi:hypothetical protein